MKNYPLINNHPQETEKLYLIQSCIKELINIFGSTELVKTQLHQILVNLKENSLLQERDYSLNNINN